MTEEIKRTNSAHINLLRGKVCDGAAFEKQKGKLCASLFCFLPKVAPIEQYTFFATRTARFLSVLRVTFSYVYCR